MRRGLAAVTALALAACGSGEPAPEASAPPVMVERAVARDVVDHLEATGQLLAQSEASVAAQVSGEITAVAVDEGGGAELGQVVVEIDPERRRLELDDSRAGVAQAKAQLEEARRDAGRVESLAGRGAASQARVDEARTRVELAKSGLLAAQARLGLAERALADASVSAPFAGLVARRYANVGEFVNAGQKLFDLVALDPLEVEFFVPEVDASRVAVGQGVDVRVGTYPDEVFRAVVSVVSPTIDPGTRTRRVKAEVPNPDGRLLPGTFARADLGVAERRGVVLVPKEAVLLRADGSVLFRVAASGDRVERVRVEAGKHREALMEIRGGVEAGDWVVVRGQSGLVDGSPVSLRNEDGSPFNASVAANQGPEG